MNLNRMLCLVLASAVCAGADVRRDYAWVSPLEGATEAGALYRVPVPGEIYARSQRFPRDLRIVDAEGAQWPFFRPAPPPATVVRELPASRVNESGPGEGRAYMRVDLHVGALADGTRPRHQRLAAATTGREFIRRIEVYGSDDEVSWGLLGQGYLVNTARPRPMTQEEVDYPVSTLPHLQVRIYPNARNAMETFAISSLRVLQLDAPPREWNEVPLAEAPVPSAERVEHAQVLLADTGYEGHPIGHLRLSAAGGDYVRPVQVYLRDRADEPWRRVASGAIQRVGAFQADRIEVGSQGRHVKCVIHHYDDPPLEHLELSAQALADTLVVEARAGADPAVYYGDAFGSAPRYDLADRAKDIKAAELPLLRLGGSVKNEAFREKGFGELGPWLAGLAVGAVSLLVVWIIIGMLPRRA